MQNTFGFSDAIIVLVFTPLVVFLLPVVLLLYMVYRLIASEVARTAMSAR